MSYRFIDTHCHFDFPPFVDNEATSLQRAKTAGVEAIIVPTVTADRFLTVQALSDRHSGVYAALGLHPIYIEQHHDETVERLTAALRTASKKVVAIGEIGLDNYIERPQLERQLVLLQQQFELAKDHNLPVILHSRRTHDVLAQQLKRAALPAGGVVHGFSGSYQQALAFIRLGYYIGVGGVITYTRAHKTRNAIAQLPLDSLLLETDAPDMPVSGFQGQPNRPERLVEILTALSEIRREPIEVIAQQTYLNTRRLFGLIS
jgi:TatD DNase family protein